MGRRDPEWLLTTAGGEQYTFDVVVSAVGLFTQPVLPDLAEEEPFTGTVMHTARWDHSVDLTDARVAVLGTGSTAAQLIPEVAKVAKKVYSVQRSPTWILPKPDREYTDREKWLFAHVPFAKKFYRTRLWMRSESNIGVIENGSDKTKEFKDIALRALDASVSDDDLRRKLTPEHPFGCKRLVFATDYLQALTQPHVEVVSSPARALRARSLVTADGSDLDVDVVLCATGYAAADYLGQIDVVGEGSATLRDQWSDGAYAYLGMTVPAFPNFFMLYGPNTNVGSNSVIFMLEAQAHYIVRALKYMRRKRKTYVAVRTETMADFIARIDEWMQGTVWLTRCSNYFRAPNGRVVTQWPRSARAFWGMTRRFRPAEYTFEPPAHLPRCRGGIPLDGDPVAPMDADADVVQRLDPALRHLATARTDLSSSVLGVVRDSLNQRRAETGARYRPDWRRDSRTASWRRFPVRIYRGARRRHRR